MAPKAPPPADPTSLLWAHQMKREHGFLLQKVEKLEVAISRIEALAIAAQNRETDLAALVQNAQTLAEEGNSKNSAATEQAVAKIRKEVTNNFEDLDERLDAIINKLDAVDKAGETAAGNRKDAFDRELEMLKRVKGIEAGMETYRDNLRLLGRKLDDHGVEQVQAQLTRLIQETNDAGEDHERVKTTLAALENATEALKRENEKLDGQVNEMRKEMAAAVAKAAKPARAPLVGSVTLTGPAPDILDEASMKKTFTGVQTVTADPAPDPSTGKPKKGRVKKSTDATVKPTGDKSMKRELAGLMKDASPQNLKRRAIKPPVNNEPALSKNLRKAAADAQVTDEKTQQPIVRKGRGWIEVVEVVPDDEAESLAQLAKAVPPSNAKQNPTRKASTDFAGSAVTVKRGPGRPRKKAAPSASAAVTVQTPVVKRGPGRPRKSVKQALMQRSIETVEAPAPKRRMIVQNDNTQARAIFGEPVKVKKRKADADAIDHTTDLSELRASGGKSGNPALVIAKRQKQNDAAALNNVQIYGKSKAKTRGSTPAALESSRGDLKDLLTSSFPPEPLASDPAHDMLELKAQKVARKRTIPQPDDSANAEFDRDFEM